jgi:hypothetical protein
VSADFLRGGNIRSLIRAMATLVQYFLLECVVFGDNEFMVLYWWCLVRCFKEYVNLAGLFFSITFLVVCI